MEPEPRLESAPHNSIWINAMTERITALDRAYRYFMKHAADLNRRYDGQFIVIADEEVLGGYKSQEDAIRAAKDKGLKPGGYLLRLCTIREDQTQHFRSRVAFN